MDAATRARRPALACAVILGLAAVAKGQRLPPVGDRPEDSLAGASNLPVKLYANLAYSFMLEDGTDVVQLLGMARIDHGDPPAQRLTAREAVIWISWEASAEGGYYRYEIYLRDDARIREAGGTLTEGRVFFVTLSSSGPLSLHVDDRSTASSEESATYQEGWAVREAFQAQGRPEAEELSTLRILTPESAEKKPRERFPLVQYQADHTQSRLVGGRLIVTATGGVLLSRGVGSSDTLEIRADGAVVFLPAQPSPAKGEEASGKAAEGLDPGVESGRGRGETVPDSGLPVGEGLRPPDAGEAMLEGAMPVDLAGGEGLRAEAAYLEGDVVLSRAGSMIRAERLYYDFVYDRALILDAVIRINLTERGVPLYIRADEIRQVTNRIFEADHAKVTTSEFHTPHYHLGAEKVVLVDQTPADFYGRRPAPTSGVFQLTNPTLNINSVPVLYWPYLRGELRESDTALKGLSLSTSESFGGEIQTRWDLFSVLNRDAPEGFDGTLGLDVFTKRGPAAGVNLDYEQDDYFGLFDGYLIHDDGTDRLGRDRRGIEPETEWRGRGLLRHRQYLPEDWQLTLELAYISDRNFLEEYYENEFDNGKEQETLLYLKKQVDNWAFTFHLQWRFMDFVTQTERLPDLGFRLVGQPIGDALTYFTENRAGVVRYRPRKPTLREFLLFGREDASGSVLRADSRHELEGPADLGPVRVVPFASMRQSAWDDARDSGGEGRIFGAYGVRGSMYFTRVYDNVQSDLWDLNGVRHIIKPDVVAWASHTNVDSHELFPFDENVERIDEVDGVTVGVRQRWQTRRGEGENRRNVDVVTWDVEAGFFNDAEEDEFTAGYASFTRPEESISKNFVNSSLIWRINDGTALVNEMNYDANDKELDVLNVSLVVERLPRFSYVVGYRFIGETDSNLLGLGINYELNEKYALAVRENIDLARGSVQDLTIGVVRRLPRWTAILAFDIDEAKDDVGFSLSLTPEGLPNAVLGPRRLTGLAESMRVTSK